MVQRSASSHDWLWTRIRSEVDIRKRLSRFVSTSSTSVPENSNTDSLESCPPSYPGDQGISFFQWIYLDALPPTTPPGRNTNPQRRYCLFRMLSVTGNGLEVFLSERGCLVIAVAQNGVFSYAPICSPAHIPFGKWVALCVVFSNVKGFFSKSTLTVYMNIDKVFEGDFKYPLFQEDLLLFHYGGCPLWVEETCYSALALKLHSKKTGTSTTPSTSHSIWSALGLTGGASSSARKGGDLDKGGPRQVSMGEERHAWGRLESFRGRLSYVVVLNETTSEAFVQWLVQGGENTCTLITDLILQNPQQRVLFYYHAKAVNATETVCLDLALSGVGQSCRCELVFDPLSLPAYLHGAQWLTSTSLVDSIHRMGGLQFLMPLFEIVGQYPDADQRPCDPGLFVDLTTAVSEFRDAMGKQAESSDSDEKSSSQVPQLAPPSTTAATDLKPRRTDSATPMDGSAKETVLNASIELLQLAATLETTTVPRLTYNLPVTARLTSRVSTLFNFVQAFLQADTRVRHNFMHPNIVMAFAHLINSIDPLQLSVPAVLSFHSMVAICTSSFLCDLDSRIQALGDLDPAAVRLAERRTAHEGFRLRFTFILQQLFLDWNLWSKVSPVAALQHVRSLLKSVKDHLMVYRAQMTVARLLTAVGFHFAPKKSICQIIKPVLQLLPPEMCDRTEVSLMEAVNVILKNIRQAFYSILRHLLSMNVTITDMRSLFGFLESPAHPEVVSEVLVLISRMFDKAASGDQFVLLTYENEICLKIFSVILSPNDRMPKVAKQKALKLIFKLAMTQKVQDKYKASLFYSQWGGLRVVFAQPELFRELAFESDTVVLLNNLVSRVFRKDISGLLQYFSVLRMASLRQRISAVALLLDLLEDSSEKVVSNLIEIRAQPAFHEYLIELLIRERREEVRVNELEGIDEDDDEANLITFPADRLGAVGRRRSSLKIPVSRRRTRNALSSSSFIASPSAEMALTDNDDLSPQGLMMKRLSFGSTNAFYPSDAHQNRSPQEDENEQEALEITLTELVVKCFHYLLWPETSLVLSEVANPDAAKSALLRYYQVFGGLVDASSAVVLVRPTFWITQRILEEFIRQTNHEIRLAALTGQAHRTFPGIAPFVGMIVDETCNRPVPDDSEFRKELLEHMNELLMDRLISRAFEKRHEEYLALTLHFLFTWAGRGTFTKNGSAAQACARLHDTICAFKQNTSFERVAFVTLRLDGLIQDSLRREPRFLSGTPNSPSPSPNLGDSDLTFEVDLEEFGSQPEKRTPEAFYFLAPLMKAVLEKYHEMLNLETLVPNLPRQSPNFIAEFLDYLQEHPQEWNGEFRKRIQRASDAYMNDCILSSSKEQNRFRMKASENLSKTHDDRTRILYLAMQQLAQAHPTFVSPVALPRGRVMGGTANNSTSCVTETLRRPNTASLLPRPGGSVSDPRRGSIHTTGVRQTLEPSKPMLLYNPQRMEKEVKVLATIRRKRWLNLRFEFVRSVSPTALWALPFPMDVYWRISTHETGLRMRGKLEPNPWFSRYLAASVNRDGFVRRISCLQMTNKDVDDVSLGLLCPGIGEDALDRILQDGCDGNQLTPQGVSNATTDLLSVLGRQTRISRVSCAYPLGDHAEFGDVDEDVVAEEDWSMIKRQRTATGPDELLPDEDPDDNSLLNSSKRSPHVDGTPTVLLTPETSMPKDKASTITMATSKSSTEFGSEVGDDGELLNCEDEEEGAAETQYFKEPSHLKGELLRVTCELISMVRIVRGWMVITQSAIHFLQNHAESVISEIASPASGEANASEAARDFSLVLGMADLREVHLCRYNLRRSAIEIFLVDHQNYLFNFPQALRNKVFTCIMGNKTPQLIYRKGRSPAEVFKCSGLMERWANREISNFEYLMRINTIAGRTYNDLSQYPVFPWILADYSSNQLNLDEPSTFRDLSRPIGIANPENIASVREKYDSFEDPSGDISKFHYGTHYSSGAGVMHYLVRTEPFTSLHIQLQDNRFDVADRQFNSIPAAWKLIMSNSFDNRELIPEFFFFPDFLRNDNAFDLGKLQVGGSRVADVELPPWASSSGAEEFIRIHRGALESDHVSANLHNWVDLIFGYKQRGKAAEDALNVFYYLTYEGAVDLDNISDPTDRASFEGMIKNFGQTPCQLLKIPHAERISYTDWVYRMLVQRSLPILNSAIIYMKTNIEMPSREASPDLSFNDRKLSVRLTRRRTQSSTMHKKGQPPIELSQDDDQHTIEIYFSYHPPSPQTSLPHTPVYTTLLPYQVVELPNLHIASPSTPPPHPNPKKRGSLYGDVNLEVSARARFVSGLKSMIPSVGGSGGSSATNGPDSAAKGNTSSGGSAGTSKHFVHQLVVVDAAGWIRNHQLTPVAQSDPDALSESDLHRRIKGGGDHEVAVAFKHDIGETEHFPSTAPEAISPSQITFENLRLSVASLRQRFLGPILLTTTPQTFRPIAGPTGTSAKNSATNVSVFPGLYAISTNGRHLYAAGRWDNRITVYNTQTNRIATLVTTPHTDVITALAVDPGCVRKAQQHGSVSQYLITGSRDGTACVWNFTTFTGRMAKQVRSDRSYIEAFESTKNFDLEGAKATAAAAAAPSGSSTTSNSGGRPQSEGYPGAMREELEACVRPGMGFDDIMLNFGCGCRVTDAGLSGGRRSTASNSNFTLAPPTEFAKVVRLFPANESGLPIDLVALYLALDMALCSSRNSNSVFIHAVKHGVWSRRVVIPDAVSIDHLLIHSVSVAFLVQWSASSETRDHPGKLQISRFDANGRLISEASVFPETTHNSPVGTRVTRMLTSTLSPSANARTVVHHVLLLSTTSGHLIMRDAESLEQLRIFSIGVPILNMSMNITTHVYGVNVAMVLENGGFVVAYPGLTAPLTTLTELYARL